MNHKKRSATTWEGAKPAHKTAWAFHADLHWQGRAAYMKTAARAELATSSPWQNRSIKRR